MALLHKLSLTVKNFFYIEGIKRTEAASPGKHRQNSRKIS